VHPAPLLELDAPDVLLATAELVELLDAEEAVDWAELPPADCVEPPPVPPVPVGCC
jgi:hypothetical protein